MEVAGKTALGTVVEHLVVIVAARKKEVATKAVAAGSIGTRGVATIEKGRKGIVEFDQTPHFAIQKTSGRVQPVLAISISSYQPLIMMSGINPYYDWIWKVDCLEKERRVEYYIKNQINIILTESDACCQC